MKAPHAKLILTVTILITAFVCSLNQAQAAEVSLVPYMPVGQDAAYCSLYAEALDMNVFFEDPDLYFYRNVDISTDLPPISEIDWAELVKEFEASQLILGAV